MGSSGGCVGHILRNVGKTSAWQIQCSKCRPQLCRCLPIDHGLQFRLAVEVKKRKGAFDVPLGVKGAFGLELFESCRGCMQHICIGEPPHLWLSAHARIYVRYQCVLMWHVRTRTSSKTTSSRARASSAAESASMRAWIGNGSMDIARQHLAVTSGSFALGFETYPQPLRA